ncbi:hypothetical protein JL720_16844 [Aureococcus anophagefferens]|nr:hypothetical protein JL720_16844 [Aureococcus anophagefferens]
MIKRAWDRGVPVWVLMLAVLGGVAIFDSIFLRRSLPLSEPSGEAPDAAPPAVEREAAPAVCDPAQAAPLAGRTPTAPVPSDDAAWATALKPMWGFEHDPRADVVMALGFGYARTEFARFVSTLRATDYAGDIVLAAGPPEKFRNGVEAYLKGEGVLAYQFTYECYKKKRGRRLLATPGCVLTNWYAGGDARGPRPLAVARYEMYRAWLANYDEASWAFVFDFRGVLPAGPVPPRRPVAVRAEPAPLRGEPGREDRRHVPLQLRLAQLLGPHPEAGLPQRGVMCSGSTLGSVPAMKRYAERMLAEMDRMACWATKAATESDQGYHNFLYHTGELAALPGVRVAHHEQGRGLVNTIGAMNGFRVPAHKKGPLDTFWKIKDADGYILDWDGQYSAVVHQWDRFGKEVVGHIDRLARAYAKAKRGAEGEDGATATGRDDIRLRRAAARRGGVPTSIHDARQRQHGRGRGRRPPPRREGDALWRTVWC